MATVTGLTAARMLMIEAMSVVSGAVQGDNLILTRRDGTQINAGNVRGPKGDKGDPGDINSSPAGGALSGNYPNPTLADGVVNGAKVADSLKDASAGTASMRTLGTGAQQAASGNHDHGDTGWVDITPPGPGDAPFSTTAAVMLQYRKRGQLVHVRLRKDSSAAVDFSSVSSGNFGNVNVFPINTIPQIARPDTVSAHGHTRFRDAVQAAVITTDGAVVWAGGHPTNYPAGSQFLADFVYYTTN